MVACTVGAGSGIGGWAGLGPIQNLNSHPTPFPGPNVQP